MRAVLLFQANIGLLIILSVQSEKPTSQPIFLNMKSNEDETNKMPRIELRAVMVPCSPKSSDGDTKEIEQFIKDMATDKENTPNGCSDNSQSTLYTDVVECTRKMLITMQINNCGKTRCEEEYIIVNHIFDVASKQKVRFLNPLVFKIKQEPLLQIYDLKAEHVVNGEATEEVINKETANYTGCDDSTQSPTCGFTYHKDTMIPYSQGFCCSCDASVNKARQPSTCSLSKNNNAASVEERQHATKEEGLDQLGVNKRATKVAHQFQVANDEDPQEYSTNSEHKISKGRQVSKQCSRRSHHKQQHNKRDTSQRYKRKATDYLPLISESTKDAFGFDNKHLSRVITNSGKQKRNLLSNNNVSYNVVNLESFVTHSVTMRPISDGIVRLHGTNFPVTESDMHLKLSDDSGYTRDSNSQRLFHAKLHKTPPVQRDNRGNKLQVRETNATKNENDSVYFNCNVDDLTVKPSNYTRKNNGVHSQVYGQTSNVTSANSIEPIYSTGSNWKSVTQPLPEMKMAEKGKQLQSKDISPYTDLQDGIESVPNRNLQTKMFQHFPNVEGKWDHHISQSENQVLPCCWTRNIDEQQHFMDNGLDESVPSHAEYLPKLCQEGTSHVSSTPMEILSCVMFHEEGSNSIVRKSGEPSYQMEFVTCTPKLNSANSTCEEPSFLPANKRTTAAATTTQCPKKGGVFAVCPLCKTTTRKCPRRTTCATTRRRCTRMCPLCGQDIEKKTNGTSLGEKIPYSDETNVLHPNALINICFRCEHECEQQTHPYVAETQTPNTCNCHNERPNIQDNHTCESSNTLDDNMRKEIANEVHHILTEENQRHQLPANVIIIQSTCCSHAEEFTESPNEDEFTHYIDKNISISSGFDNLHSENNHTNTKSHATINSTERATSNYPNKEVTLNDIDARIWKIVKSKEITGNNSVSQNIMPGSIPNFLDESRNNIRIKPDDKLVDPVLHLKPFGYRENNQNNITPLQGQSVSHFTPQISCTPTALEQFPNHPPNKWKRENYSNSTPESLFDIDLNNNDVLIEKHRIWYDNALSSEIPKLVSKRQNYVSENRQEFLITDPSDTEEEEIEFDVGSSVTPNFADQDDSQDVDDNMLRQKRSFENDSINKDGKDKSVQKKSSFNLLYGGPVYRKPHHRMFNPLFKHKDKDEKNLNKITTKKVTRSEGGDLVRKARHAKKLPIRQVLPNGLQIRGGQDCNDKTTPPCVDPTTYHESAHCLRFSDLWYTVYKVEPPSLEHTISVQMFEKHTLSDGGVYWKDLTKGAVLSVGTVNRHVMDEVPTVSITYSTSKDIVPPYTLDPDSHRLLIPQSVPMNKLDMYPQLQAGANEYLVLTSKDISFDGENCDKSGVGFSAFAKQFDRCGRPKGTCLKNQPVDYWRRDIEARLTGTKGTYFLENFAMLPSKPMRTNSISEETSLMLEYQGAYSSTMEIEVKGDHTILVKTGDLVRLSWVLADSTVNDVTLLTVTVTNLGLASSTFWVRLSDCDPCAPDDWNHELTPNITIPPQFSHDFLINLSGTLPPEYIECTVNAVNHRSEVVANRKARFLAGDRCICLWHCLCACLSTAGALPCDPMTTKDYKAAGFQDSMPIVTGAAMGDLFYTFLANFIVFGLAMFIILLCFGIIKGILGITCCPAVGAWGLGLMVEQSRRIPHYFEKHLRERPVFYDEDGYPVHPDTKERSVRTTSRCMELLLNVIFFLIFPIVILVAICRRCCGKPPKWDDPESGTCFRWMNTVVIGEHVKEEANCYCYDDPEDEEDTKEVMAEMNRSQETLRSLQRNSQESDPLLNKNNKPASTSQEAETQVRRLVDLHVVYRNVDTPIGGVDMPPGFNYSIRGFFIKTSDGFKFLATVPLYQHWILQDGTITQVNPPLKLEPENFDLQYTNPVDVYNHDQLSELPRAICVNLRFQPKSSPQDSSK